MKCWEFKKCGREKGGKNELQNDSCPAYPDYGDCCAPVVGTLCAGEVKGTYARKIDDCLKCSFYKSRYYNRLKTVQILKSMEAEKAKK